MSKFYSMIVAATLLAGTVSLVFAQGGAAGPKGGQKGPQAGQRGPGGPGGPGGQRRGGMGAIMEKIQPPVTADQKKKIEAINKKYREQMMKLRGGTPGQRPTPGQGGGRPQMDDATRKKFMDLMKKRNDEIMKVLNAKQQASYKKLVDEMMKRFQNGGGPGGPRGGGAPRGGNKPPL